MDSVTTTETSSNSATEVRLLGRVKWFNNKAGYGFITVTDGERSGSDIFVHHSGIRVSSEQYRYLVQGEYVEFTLDATQNGAHEVQAKNVSGIHGGLLMCETRRDFRQARQSYRGEQAEGTDAVSTPAPTANPRSARPPSRGPRGRGSGPREGREWTMVDNRSNRAPKRPRNADA